MLLLYSKGASKGKGTIGATEIHAGAGRKLGIRRDGLKLKESQVH